MPRVEQLSAPEGGWSRWVVPLWKRTAQGWEGFVMAHRNICCGCGLAHDAEYVIVPVIKQLKGKDRFEIGPVVSPRKYRVLFRLALNNRSTAQIRRKRRKV